MSYTRITVPLSREELNALRDAADREYRHPRDQARYLVRQALGLTSEEKHNGAAQAVTGNCGAAVMTVQG